MGLLSIIWAIIVILLIVWIIGLIIPFAGGFIYILLVVAIILIIYNLIMHSRGGRL